MKFEEKYIFGTASLHHKYFKRKIFRILDISYEVGFRIYDTSPYYGLGYNELVLLKWIKSRKLSDVTVHTKMGLCYPYFRSRSIWHYLIQRIVSTSDHRMKPRLIPVDNLYSRYPMVDYKLFLHEPMKHKDFLGLLEELVFDGIAGYVPLGEKKKLAHSIILQTPFNNYPNGDIYYGIYSCDRIFDFGLNGKFIFSSNKKERILRFRENYEKGISKIKKV